MLKAFLINAKGTTLVELLIAIVILAVGILGAMALFPQAYKGITRAGHISTLNHLGYQKIDQLRASASANWSHADLTDGGHPATPAARMVGSTFPDYSITWVVDDDTPAGETGEIKTIVVEVGYLVYDSNGNAITHQEVITKKFQTFIAK
ncbi:prepilin-type N-terminal cleavage/methylation domain-containing protein [bacterium]|nr:prepilin-type N-terminal cleavage/methylation domain-containing protein [bacterium]